MKVKGIVFAILVSVAAVFILNFVFLYFVYVPGSLFILPFLLGGAGLIVYDFFRSKDSSFDDGKNSKINLASPSTSEKGQKRTAVVLLVSILLMFGIIGLVMLRLRAAHI